MSPGVTCPPGTNAASRGSRLASDVDSPVCATSTQTRRCDRLSLRRTFFLVGLKPTTKLMAQHLFGSRRRVMLSFERQPLPGACHVDQDVPHSQGRRALGHLTTFDRVLSALH